MNILQNAKQEWRRAPIQTTAWIFFALYFGVASYPEGGFIPPSVTSQRLVGFGCAEDLGEIYYAQAEDDFPTCLAIVHNPKFVTE